MLQTVTPLRLLPLDVSRLAKMKYLLPTIISIPTVFACAIVVYNQATGTYALDFLPANWRTLIIILPLFGFAASVAMLFIKENAIEWRIAAIVNAFPFVLVLLAGLLGFGR